MSPRRPPHCPSSAAQALLLKLLPRASQMPLLSRLLAVTAFGLHPRSPSPTPGNKLWTLDSGGLPQANPSMLRRIASRIDAGWRCMSALWSVHNAETKHKSLAVLASSGTGGLLLKLCFPLFVAQSRGARCLGSVPCWPAAPAPTQPRQPETSPEASTAMRLLAPLGEHRQEEYTNMRTTPASHAQGPSLPRFSPSTGSRYANWLVGDNSGPETAQPARTGEDSTRPKILITLA